MSVIRSNSIQCT